ncbi:lysine--tRNA ligase [candidate division WOR-3 bacterium]|nr:lysine--tRNA ligase [candidate division WOR-3 bacterium]
MIENLNKMKELGENPYKYRYDITHSIKEILEKPDNFVEKEIVSVAGRVISKRRHGKVMFLDIKDEMAKMQVYLRKDDIGADIYEIAKLMDIGDIIGVKGQIFKTRTEELTVKSDEFTLLSKSLKPLPEKFHGLQDKEIRYRKRYIDLIMNDDVKAVFFKRSEIIETIRKVLKGYNFLEVETPVLQPVYGGAFAEPFTTHHNAQDMKLYLRIANELYLKRLIVGGINRVFEFAKDFRNEGMDKTHNPEFTQVEFYQAYADYEDMMTLVEEIFENLVPNGSIEYQEQKIDFKRPWKRIDFYGSIKEKTGFDIKDKTLDELKDIAKNLHIDIENKKTRGKIIDEIFSETVQNSLINPTFVINQPIEISPLAKMHRNIPGVVERFEPIIAGMEVGNAFSELNDPLDQQERFNEQIKERKLGDSEAFEFDIEFIEAIKHGMPPTGGVGLGIDRIVMILTDSPSIRDVILFPLLKKEK